MSLRVAIRTYTNYFSGSSRPRCNYCGGPLDDSGSVVDDVCEGCHDELALDDGYWSEGMPRYN